MSKPLTIDGAWRIFLTILEMSGFSIIPTPDVYKIVPVAQKLKQPLTSYINIDSSMLPATDETIRYVTFLDNINVSTIKDLVAGMLGTPNSVIAQTDVNGFIITGRSNDISSAMKVVKELDQTGLQESVEVIRLTNANATDVKALFDSLMQKPKGHPLARLLGKKQEVTNAYFPATTKIFAETRTNSLILIGSIDSIKKIEKFIIEKVDTKLKDVKSPLHIYELEYADATQVEEILKQVTAPDGLQTEAGQTAARYGAVRGGVKYFKSMNIRADKQGNRLLISTTDEQDWELVKQTIKDLDKAQPQVAIEVLVVAVNLTDQKALGAQLRNKKHGQIGKHIDFQAANLTSPILETDANGNAVSLLGNLINALAGTIGSTVLTFGKTAAEAISGKACCPSGKEKANGVWAAFELINQIETASIISQPFITVANKTEATIKVGETRRIVSQRAVSEAGTIGTDSASGFTDKKAYNTIKVTPQINLDGIINFKINVDFEDFLNDRGDTQVRSLDTDVMIANGQVLVLGGFVKTKVTESSSKTPLLHKIPLLGWFFKRKARRLEKQHVFIFMSPTILKPRLRPGVNLYTKMKLHNSETDVENFVKAEDTNDPIHNWFFNSNGHQYSKKIKDFANARYQPTSVDIANDPYYRGVVDEEGFADPSLLLAEAERRKPQEDLDLSTPELIPGQVGSDDATGNVSGSLSFEVDEYRQIDLQKTDDSMTDDDAQETTDTNLKPILPPMPPAPVSDDTHAPSPEPAPLPPAPLPPAPLPPGPQPPAPAPQTIVIPQPIVHQPAPADLSGNLDEQIEAKRSMLKQLFIDQPLTQPIDKRAHLKDLLLPPQQGAV